LILIQIRKKSGKEEGMQQFPFNENAKPKPREISGTLNKIPISDKTSPFLLYTKKGYQYQVKEKKKIHTR